MSIDLKTLKIAAVVNAASGGCHPGSGDELDAALARHGLKAASRWCGGGDGVDAALDQALARAPDLLIVLGGDGTIRAAAARCEAKGPILAPLAGGTMNYVAGALYGKRPWAKALEATLSAPTVREVDGAEAAGERFFAGAMFGQPALLAQAREAARGGRFAQALQHGVSAVRGTLDLELACTLADGRTTKGEVVSITTPLMAEDPSKGAHLEVAAADFDTPGDVVRLLLVAGLRDWRADAAVARADTAAFEISANAPIPALLDGEQFTFDSPVRVRVLAGAFRALVPA